MKKTLVERLHAEPPEEMRRIIEGGILYDSSCSKEARVYFIDKDDGYYLKAAPKGTLHAEAQMTSYFHKKGLAPEVLSYASQDLDWLLTAKARGEDCTNEMYLLNPKRLCDTIAEMLRSLHETDFSGCPVMNKNERYLKLAEENYRSGNYDSSYFPDSFGYASAESAYRTFTMGKNAISGKVLLHGDYCLPNIMLDNWRPAGFIDLGAGGVGDRHIDIFWGVWTLGFNLKTYKYTNRFKDAYGRDKIDDEVLKTVAAAEVFG